MQKLLNAFIGVLLFVCVGTSHGQSLKFATGEAGKGYSKIFRDINQGTPLEQNVQGPFIHRKDDDDSAAVTFWSRGKLREVLQKAINLLDEHHAKKNRDPLGR
jgi:hypothetical protein